MALVRVTRETNDPKVYIATTPTLLYLMLLIQLYTLLIDYCEQSVSIPTRGR